jgi:hypothetical protein
MSLAIVGRPTRVASAAVSKLSVSTHNATFSGAFATPNFRHLFISTKRRLAAAEAGGEGLKVRRSSRFDPEG